MNKQQLAARIWESANKMRSKIEANEYKDYILGFIFYKFLSDKEISYLKSQGITETELKEIKETEKEVVENIQNNLGYFISYENLFTTWITKGKDFSIKDVRDALSAFSRLISNKPNHKKVFTNIFRTLDTGLSKLGDNASSQTKAVSDLLNLIKDIPMDGKQDYDVLGFIYEYLISMFAANAGKKAGEFYTPHEVSVLMSEIVAHHIQNHKQDTFEIYDPTSGSGSLLITIGKALSKYIDKEDNIKYFAQELIESTYNLTRMNLVMRGINPANIVTRNGDTLEEDWPFFDDSDPTNTYEPLYVDAVVSNPPYSQQWNPTNKGIQPRYEYGLAPTSKADYAFLLHDLYHIKPDGIMTIVLPHGVLFRGGEEGEIRKNLIENNKIDTIIGLPANIFFGTGIPTIIMVLKKNRENNDVLIIDASKNFEKVGKQNKLQSSDIKRIVDVVVERKTVHKFSRVVSKEEIRSNDYNLNIPRYVDSGDETEYFDIYATINGDIPSEELSKFQNEWNAFPSLKEQLFNRLNDCYYEIRTDNIKDSIAQNNDVIKFVENYKKSFVSFKEYLKEELINKIESVNINKEEDIIAKVIFEKLQNIPLIDKYKVYQCFDDEWQQIAIDLEIIQSEGIESCNKIEPNLIIKGKDEIQDGWKGKIMPFTLVQKMFFADELNSIKTKESEIEQKQTELAELIPETEDENEEIELTDEQKKQQKLLSEKIKTIKKEIVKLQKELEEKTIKKIEVLTEEERNNLLEEKWIVPLCDTINKMSESVIDSFSSSLSKMLDKYSDTLTSIENEIIETQESLFSLMNELTGSEFDMKGLAELQKLLGGM